MIFKFINKYSLILGLLVFFIACSEEKTVMPPNCNKGEENSILEKCNKQNKECTVRAQVASCTTCFDGFIPSGDSCIKIETCSDLNCESQNKYCEHFDKEDHAECVGCLDGFKLVEDECRTVIKCDILNCSSENKECIKSGNNTDAKCSDCLNFFKKEDDNTCYPVLRCEDLNPSCKDQNKACIHTNTYEDASCSKSCLNGFHKNETGNCIKTITCDSLDCFGEQKRICNSESPIESASCGRCLGGFEENEDGVCEEMDYTSCDTKPAVGSILLECSQEHKTCVKKTNSTKASCGECLEGYFLVNNTCVIPVECSILNCEEAHKECIGETNNKECGACKTGFILNTEDNICECKEGILNRETNLCENIKTCSSITCSSGETCIEGSNNYHAYCSKCEEGQAWNSSESKCKSCQTCDAKGETGKVHPVTSSNHCVCETKENYFTSASSVYTIACDEDKDGWITKEAETAINAPENSAIKMNAKCNLRYINRFVLKNEAGQERVISISDVTDGSYTKIPLYETESRDNQIKLNDDYIYDITQYFAPAYGMGTANVDTFYFNASQLNMLTKAIPAGSSHANASQADYNANGKPDLDEKPWKLSKAKTVEEVYNKFSYFIELNKAWYEKKSNELYGSYVINEKKRELNALYDTKIQFVNPNNKSYWRECYRKIDAKASDNSGAGLDFTDFHYASCTLGDRNSWCGMNHHSQFKAFKVVKDKEVLNPQYITVDELEASYIVNKCFSYNTQYNIISNGVLNPSTPVTKCVLVENPKIELKEGDIVWAIAKYKDYSGAGETYIRSCINECLEMNTLEEEDRCVAGVSCSTASGDYGRLICSEGVIMSKIIPGGVVFMMGSEDIPENTERNVDEKPTYSRLSQSYEISTKEIDQVSFEDIMGYNPSFHSCGRSSCPVENLTWFDAIAFTNRYNELQEASNYDNCYKLTGITCSDDAGLSDIELADDNKKYCQERGGIKIAAVENLNYLNCNGYRLPTETEWEFAAKATDYDQKYYIPFDYEELGSLSQIAWYGNIESSRTKALGLKLPNKYFLFDILGNVKEWIHDYYGEYPDSAIDSPQIDYINLIADANSTKVIRGGGFDSEIEKCRNMAREFSSPSTKSKSLGFRIARSYINLVCRTYLKETKTNNKEIINGEVLEKGRGYYTSEYKKETTINTETGLEETSYKYLEQFYITPSETPSLIIETTYNNKNDFIFEDKASKDNFLTKKISFLDENKEYNFSKLVDKIIVTELNNDLFKMTYPASCSFGTNCVGSFETIECTGIKLNLIYTELKQIMTFDYSNSFERGKENDPNHVLTNDICRKKANRTNLNYVDSLGNMLNFAWLAKTIQAERDNNDEYINICK